MGHDSSNCGITNGHEPVVAVLLENGAAVDQEEEETDDEYGWPALMYAAEHGHAETVKLLLSGGALVDRASEDGVTALMRSCLRVTQPLSPFFWISLLTSTKPVMMGGLH